MKPLRREYSYQIAQDPVTGEDVIISVIQEENTLSSEGSVDVTKYHRNTFLKCGCQSEEVGGRCYVCGGYSCPDCFSRCQSCLKPLCPDDSKFFDAGELGQIRLCDECMKTATRKKKSHQLKGKLNTCKQKLLSFFIQWDQ